MVIKRGFRKWIRSPLTPNSVNRNDVHLMQVSLSCPFSPHACSILMMRRGKRVAGLGWLVFSSIRTAGPSWLVFSSTVGRLAWAGLCSVVLQDSWPGLACVQ